MLEAIVVVCFSLKPVIEVVGVGGLCAQHKLPLITPTSKL